ncbi:MAG TPA: hypothetical protein VGR11_12685 [Solirubrobacteraceae bacterium]|nr:hypothetical protein [Solirubrobacteraceae bacterium]
MVLSASPAHAEDSTGATRAAAQDPNTIVMTRSSITSVIGTVRKVAKCALGIAGFVGGNIIAVSKLRKAGAVWKVAKRTWLAKGKTGKVKVLTAVFGEVTGLNAVAEGCGV